MDISDADLIAKLTITEDPFTERKSNSDRAGWLKAVVAFANSTPIDQPAVLFVGVDDAGAICPGNGRIDDLMKSFSDFIAKQVYPPVYTFPKELQHGGLSCLAVIVMGSPNRPHFAGQSYVRDGTQTKIASETQFDSLIAERQSKLREIRKYLGKTVTLWHVLPEKEDAYRAVHSRYAEIIDCNTHFITVKLIVGETPRLVSIPISWIELSFDHRKDRLVLCVPATNFPRTRATAEGEGE